MYPAPFEYLRAASWQEAVAWLQELGDDAKVLAGGQSLVPLMSLRLVTPKHIIDVNGADRPGIRRTDRALEIGGLTRHAELEESSLLAEACPLLQEAAGLIGNVRVRHRGTIGGSLAHADPSGELPCALLALEGVVRVLGPDGERRIAAADFFLSYFTTALEAAEVVTGVEIPMRSGRSGSAFLEMVRRTGDFATVEVGAVVDVDDAGHTCRDVRVAIGGIADRPLDLSEAARVLVGEELQEAAVANAARAVADASDPREDERASTDYRRRLTEVLTRRVLLMARERARAEGG